MVNDEEEWIVAVFLTGRKGEAVQTWEYDQLHHAQVEAEHIRKNGFAMQMGGVWLHYGAHRVDFVAVRKKEV